MKSIQRALVVDDQVTFARSVESALAKRMGVPRVRTVGTLDAARAALEQFRPELVLLDVGLPDGCGLSLLDDSAALAERPMCIIVTIFDDDAHLFDAVRRGAGGYILKEESGAELVRMLEEVLRGRPPLSDSIARRILEHLRVNEDPSRPSFTEREQAIVRLLAQGTTVSGTAKVLGISAHTVQHHVKSVYRKLDVHSRAELTRAAIDLGLA